MKILFVNAGQKKYGGKVYEKMTREVLSNNFEIGFKNVGIEKFKYLKFPLVLWRLFKISRRKNFDLAIKDFDSSLFLNKKPTKNIAIVHHIDYFFAPLLIKFASFFSTPLILRNLRKADAIVVVSKKKKLTKTFILFIMPSI